MELNEAKAFIGRNIAALARTAERADTARRYYMLCNDIKFSRGRDDADGENILRRADNRVCSGFYPLLVNQKAAYLFTSPPLFDVGNKKTNREITRILGDDYVKKCQKLCIGAANCGIAWVHFWRDAADGAFRWSVIDGTQVVSVADKELDGEIYAVIRCYTKIDENDGKPYLIYEIWNDRFCESFCTEANADIDALLPFYAFSSPQGDSNIYEHGLGRVPFIPFANNSAMTTDLENIKGLIDTYDKTYNGFANDLEDIQEVILTLSGYGGTDLKSFLSDLKKYKVIKLDDPQSGGVGTLNIEVPVEARKTMLDITQKAIFTQGMGVDPQRDNFSNASGVALKFLYSLLELKAGQTQTEFMGGFGALVRAICRFYKLPIKNDAIVQTWTRTAISNDLETANIAQSAAGIISNATIVKNHPWVENPDAELAQIQKEQQQDAERAYFGAVDDGDNNSADDA